MRILIHAVPERMWYVDGFLVPDLRAQGAADIEIWCDREHKGNLAACLDSFEAREGDGATWHLQDDVLVRSDFVKRYEALDEDVIYGFCHRHFGDRPDAWGRVYAPDAWHSFQCVRIPDAYARDCAAWVRSMKWERESDCPELPVLWKANKGDDTFFRQFMICRHFADVVYNARPNLVEHVDWLIGGSTLHHYRSVLARSEYWDEPERVEQLHRALKERNVRIGQP